MTSLCVPLNKIATLFTSSTYVYPLRTILTRISHKRKCTKGRTTIMDAILTILTFLTLLTVGIASLVWMLFIRKKGNTTKGQLMNPLAGGPRYRDGAVTYNQFDGKRYNIEVEIPDGQSARFRRRHPAKRHRQTKPWMK